jgi:outer membrane protein assembly factor BamB
MGDGATCQTHPGEKTIVRCSSCQRGICRLCREALGYFCSEECRKAVIGEEPPAAEKREKSELARLDERITYWMRMTKYRILPGAGAFLAVLIALVVMGKKGEVVWEFAAPPKAALSDFAASDDLIYVACSDGSVHALDKATGEPLWTRKAGNGLLSARPVLVRRDLLLVWDESAMYALDRSDGKLRRTHDLASPVTWAPAFSAGVVCFACDYYREPTREEKAADRRSKWHFGASTLSDLGVRAGTRIFAVDALKGAELWNRDAGAGFSRESLAVSEGVAYVSAVEWGEKGPVYTCEALDLRTGKAGWKAKVSGGHSTSVQPTPGGIVVVSPGNLYFVSRKGLKLWRAESEESHWAPVVIGDGVYLMTEERLTCLDLASGKKRWEMAIGERTSRPSGDGRTVYLASFRKVRVAGGTEEEGKGPSLAYRKPGVEDVWRRFADSAEPGCPLRGRHFRPEFLATRVLRR